MVRRMLVVAVLIAVLLGAAGGYGKSPLGLAQLLRDRDPGARVGGDTIVLAGKGERIVGVPHRPNFMIALGSHETIVGGAQDDELGSLGAHVRIVAGRSGHELLVGGPQATVVVGGRGRDLIVESRPGATIVLESPGDEVIASGKHDRIECLGGATHDTIYRAATDAVGASCERHHDTLLPVGSRPHALRALAVAHAAVVTGAGTNDNPYTAPCDTAGTVCTVTFPSRTLTGLWANESVPAYRCPSTNQWLYHHYYAPSGTYLPPGVEVLGLGPIGVSIRGNLVEGSGFSRAIGTRTNDDVTPFASSATNWTTGSASYRVVLHCTSSLADAYYAYPS